MQVDNLGIIIMIVFAMQPYDHDDLQVCATLLQEDYSKTPPKWQKNDLVSGGHGCAAKLGACVDWLRTSADKRMWSGRRAVVMVR